MSAVYNGNKHFLWHRWILFYLTSDYLLPYCSVFPFVMRQQLHTIDDKCYTHRALSRIMLVILLESSLNSWRKMENARKFLMKFSLAFAVGLHICHCAHLKFQSVTTFVRETLERQILFIWIQWQTLTMHHVNVLVNERSFMHSVPFGNGYFFLVTCSFCHCAFISLNIVKLMHQRHLHLNTITFRWHKFINFSLCLFFVLVDNLHTWHQTSMVRNHRFYYHL